MPRHKKSSKGHSQNNLIAIYNRGLAYQNFRALCGNANNDSEGVPDALPPTYEQTIEDIEWRASFGVSNGKSYFCNNLRYCGAAFYSKDSIKYHVCGDKYTLTKNRKYYNR
ncbi:hypothetical protein RIR_jg31201.t1 [Rhizophagus irregularis DAOM 181602=DAOM 197198]|nr:hypothetical protein RIR_jg31201.t1 [Rhizophagus irregularis DAOM 181602=DAOM 197198]